MRITLHIADRPTYTWSLNYPIIPRVGDRVLHPSSDKILLRVDSVLIHRDGRDSDSVADAEIYCSEIEG